MKECEIRYATYDNPELEARDELFKLRSLEHLATLLRQKQEVGYPTRGNRLKALGKFGISDDSLTIPFGEWDTTSQAEVLPPPEETEELRSLDLPIDRFGRPLHPWLASMLIDSRIGVATGKGIFYNWGPNDTADPIILRQQEGNDEILLVQRKDTGQWALPGGFVDTGEEAIDAAVREAQEEAGIDLEKLNPRVTEVYWGPVADIRITAHAWPNTTAYLFDIPGPTPSVIRQPVEGDPEVMAANWFPVNQLHDTRLFGSHYQLIELALHERRHQ